MRFYLKLALFLIAVTLRIPQSAHAQSQVELITPRGSYVGKPVAHNKQICWLASEDGSYANVLFDEVTTFRKHPDTFRVQSQLDLRTQLKSEFSKSFEVIIRGSFVVAGPPDRTKAYADLVDRMSRSFSQYTSVRRLPVDRMEYPLVVLIFSNQGDFQKYARGDEINGGSLLKGYYHPHSNRVALFESERDRAALDTRFHSATRSGSGTRYRSASQPKSISLPPQTASTLIHEGIHQLAFNKGLHSRIGQNPRWIVEGLATMLEASGDMNLTRSDKSSTINESRLTRFQAYSKAARKETIADFIADDEKFFRGNVLNAYSQAWAITYFLAEEYPSAYARFLKRVAQRDALDEKYSAEERVADFQAEFGKDLPWLEVKFLRFIDGLEVSKK